MKILYLSLLSLGVVNRILGRSSGAARRAAGTATWPAGFGSQHWPWRVEGQMPGFGGSFAGWPEALGQNRVAVPVVRRAQLATALVAAVRA